MSSLTLIGKFSGRIPVYAKQDPCSEEDTVHLSSWVVNLPNDGRGRVIP